MLEVVFHGADGTGSVRLAGPIGVNLARGTIDAGGPVLASHAQDGWFLGTLRITRITCVGPIDLELRDEQRTFGPFVALEIDADTISSAEGLFADYNSFTKRWHLRVKDADQSAAKTETPKLMPA